MSDRVGGSSSGSRSGDEFGRAVAQALEAAGFNCTYLSVVDALVDFFLLYITHLGCATTFHTNLTSHALANEYDIIQSLEEIGTDFDGFVGASTASGHCLVGSGVVRDLVAFVESKDEVPFMRPLPRFPVLRVPQPASSFEAAGRETRMRHVPEWLPVFLDPHTYVRTEVWSEQAGVDMVEQVRQWRKGEKLLLSLQQRLALASTDGVRPVVVEDNAEKAEGDTVI